MAYPTVVTWSTAAEAHESVVEGVDPSSLVATCKRLESATGLRTRDEGMMADDLIEQRGYALRWYKGRGVIVHRTMDEWTTHTGQALADWLRARGETVACWSGGV